MAASRLATHLSARQAPERSRVGTYLRRHPLHWKSQPRGNFVHKEGGHNRRDSGRGASGLSRSTDADCAACQYDPDNWHVCSDLQPSFRTVMFLEGSGCQYERWSVLTRFARTLVHPWCIAATAVRQAPSSRDSSEDSTSGTYFHAKASPIGVPRLHPKSRMPQSEDTMNFFYIIGVVVVIVVVAGFFGLHV